MHIARTLKYESVSSTVPNRHFVNVGKTFIFLNQCWHGLGLFKYILCMCFLCQTDWNTGITSPLSVRLLNLNVLADITRQHTCPIGTHLLILAQFWINLLMYLSFVCSSYSHVIKVVFSFAFHSFLIRRSNLPYTCWFWKKNTVYVCSVIFLHCSLCLLWYFQFSTLYFFYIKFNNQYMYYIVVYKIFFGDCN